MHSSVVDKEQISVSDALVMGLIAQGVRKFFVVLGHGTTDFGNALRKSSDLGLIQVTPFRNEIEATHAASALQLVAKEKVAVVTSIGPGALQAVAASLVSISNGLGVWFIFGDETTHDEGDNMQQIPGRGQSTYFRALSEISATYLLHTPQALISALREGSTVTNHPSRPQPFFLLVPINIQPKKIEDFDLRQFPTGEAAVLGPANSSLISKAADILNSGSKIVIKVGRGAAGCGFLLQELAELIGGVLVLSPSSLGIVPYEDARCMGVGGSKGSISGNYAMEQAELLVVIGSRSVCQSDCSRTGYPLVKEVINLNADARVALNYNFTTSLVGTVSETLPLLIQEIRSRKESNGFQSQEDSWLKLCSSQKLIWAEHKNAVLAQLPILDSAWHREVMTQPVVINAALEWVQENDYKVFFDAGDVQANGFQLAEVESEGWFFTESGSSYMGFASSALLAGSLADSPFYGVAISGDGSFMMNPQVLIDAIHAKTEGCIILLDNQRMGAISSLQREQYGIDFATSDQVHVDYVAMANSISGINGVFGGYSLDAFQSAMESAREFKGFSLIHVPVYFGEAEHSGMGSYGRWNVGTWVDEVEALIMKGRI